MDGWTTVGVKKSALQGQRKGSRKEKPSRLKTPAWTDEQIYKFLASFKTTPCENRESHDPRNCRHYHEFQKDGRRNPYKVRYEVDDACNITERIYHPVVFRTSLCQHKPCPFNSTCAHAHSGEALRVRAEPPRRRPTRAPGQHRQGRQLRQLQLRAFLTTPTAHHTPQARHTYSYVV